MKKIFEIRWHGRGGQGAKTAALLFGEAAIATGKYLQAFPEYGPERMGAPVQAFNRISEEPITLHCGVKEPDIVVVLDPTLLESQPITEGLKEDGSIIINTTANFNDLRKKLNIHKQKLFTIDASTISRETLGRDLPNTPMLGALTKVVGIISLDDLLSFTKKQLEKKFRGGKEKFIKGNLDAIRRGYEEVKSS